jgi:lysophospholipase L1-like esterase
MTPHLRFLPLALFVLTIATFAATAGSAHLPPYLALGDSVTFGYITQAGFEYVNPHNFLGYPTYVGPNLELSAKDAACPGETTGSFLSSTAPDNGCRAFRSQFPLHVFYTSTQLAFAQQFLINHKQTRLVTVLLGANDIFLLQAACLGDPTCISNGLPAVLATITANLGTILNGIRGTGYKGRILLLNYYSLDYSNAADTQIAEALDQAIAEAGALAHVPVVDVFSAFRFAASFAGGNTCQAGLLNVNPNDLTQLTCDVHPSQSGQQLLAGTVEAAFR